MYGHLILILKIIYQSIDNFIDSMENEKETITGPSQAIRILKILEKADDRLNQ